MIFYVRRFSAGLAGRRRGWFRVGPPKYIGRDASTGTRLAGIIDDGGFSGGAGSKFGESSSDGDV